MLRGSTRATGPFFCFVLIFAERRMPLVRLVFGVPGERDTARALDDHLCLDTTHLQPTTITLAISLSVIKAQVKIEGVYKNKRRSGTRASALA